MASRFLRLRYILIVALVIVAVVGFSLGFPKSQDVKVYSSPPTTQLPTTPPDALLPPDLPPSDDECIEAQTSDTCPIVEPPILPEQNQTVPIGTAFVTITIHFEDGTEKVITATFSLLTVAIEGKNVSWLRYQVSVQFSGLGDVGVSGLEYGLYIIGSDNVAHKVVSQTPPALGCPAPCGVILAGQSSSLVDFTVQASSIDSFLTSSGLATGSYALRFYTSFAWSGTSVQLLDGARGYGVAAIYGPDIPASISFPASTPSDPNPPPEFCFGTRDSICIV